MDYELNAWILISALLVVVIVALIVKMIMKKRRKATKKVRHHVDRVSSRCSEKTSKEEKPAGPKLPFYDVERPRVLVWANAEGKSRLILQRAQCIDERYFQPINEDETQLSSLTPLFKRVQSLTGDERGNLSDDIFTLNFSEEKDETLEELTLFAMSSSGVSMGEKLKERISSELIQDLRCASESQPIHFVLESKFRSTIDQIESRYINGASEQWSVRIVSLKNILMEISASNSSQEMTDKVKIIGTEIQENLTQINSELVKHTDSLTCCEDVEKAVPDVLPLIEERELSGRVLLLFPMLETMNGCAYFEGFQKMTEAKKIALDISTVDQFLGTVVQIMSVPNESAKDDMSEDKKALFERIQNKVAEVRQRVESARNTLCEESANLQRELDNYLIHRDMPPRYAVRLNEDGNVIALMKLRSH